MNRRHLWILALVLVGAGLGMFAYKWKFLGFPLTSDDVAEAWTIEAHVTFTKLRSGPVKAELRLPADPPGLTLIDEQFISRGYRVTIEGEGDTRRAIWAKRRAQGGEALYYRARVFRDEFQRPPRPAPPYPDVPALEEPHATGLQQLVDRVRNESADIATFVSAALGIINEPTPPEAVRLFLGSRSSELDKARFARTVLQAARIPAEIVQALRLSEERREAELEPWLLVHNGEEWLYFNPRDGRRGLPRDLLIWAMGDEPVIEVDGVSGEVVAFSGRRTLEDALRVAELRTHASHPRLIEFSLLDLPLQTQSVYSILLLVPVGAFLIVLLRNVIGIGTFGTFMPVLIAMAFRETKLLAGMVLFTLIVALGLAMRFYLERLRLLLIPRLAAVLTIVVMLMVAVSILSHRLGIEIGLSVALFPMVIMAMTIERMSIVWEERGPAEAMKEGVGTLVAAAAIYLVMITPAVKHFVLVFPELLLVVLAGTLLLGRYTGYRLTELTRFGALAGGGR